MSKTYTAEYAGKIVGKRTTKDYTYTHAVVVTRSIEYASKAAYGYQATKTDRCNFNYFVTVAEGRSPFSQTPEDVIKASMRIDGGFDAYVKRLRIAAIARFKEQLASGEYKPKVAMWCSRLDLAQKAMGQYRKPWNDKVEIVPVVEVIKKIKAPV